MTKHSEPRPPPLPEGWSTVYQDMCMDTWLRVNYYYVHYSRPRPTLEEKYFPISQVHGCLYFIYCI